MNNLRQYETDQTKELLDLVARMNRLSSDMGGRNNRPERKALAQCMRILVKCIEEQRHA